MSQPTQSAFPTEFPAIAAAKVGRAILAKTWTADLAEPLYELVGYFLGRMLAADSRPTFGAGIAPAVEDDIGEMLIEAGRPTVVDAEGFAAAPFDLALIPWDVVLPLLIAMLKRIIDVPKAA